jgi:hypothetical protein
MLFVGMDIILLIAWTVWDPPRLSLNMNAALSIVDIKTSYTPGCVTNTGFMISHLTATGLLLLAGALIAHKCESLPDKFNEASSIFICLFFMLTFGVVIMPLNFLAASSTAGLIVIRGMYCTTPTLLT